MVSRNHKEPKQEIMQVNKFDESYIIVFSNASNVK